MFHSIQLKRPPNNPLFRPDDVEVPELLLPLIGVDPNDSNCFDNLLLASLFLIKYAAPKPRAANAIFLFIIVSS
jgi:hypothetical protein